VAKVAKKNLDPAPKTEDPQSALDIEPKIPAAAEDPTPLTAPTETPTLEAEKEEDEPPSPIEPEPQKRRPGRPSKNEPPVLRSGIIDRINNLESWESTRVYVYRWEPFHNRQVGGKQSVSVKRYEGPFDEQDMLEDPGLGSGLYELVVNRTDPTTRQRRVIDSGTVKLLNMKFPPRIPKGEWVDDPRNKDWEWARNICDKSEIPAPVALAPPADPMIELLREQNRNQHEEMRAYRERIDKLQDEMRQTASKKDPNEQTLISIIAPVLPAIVQRLLEPPKPDPTQALFMQYLMKQAEQKPETAKPTDAAAELDKVLDLQAKIEERLGGSRNGRSRKTGWQEVISDVAGPVSEILKPIVTAGVMMQAQRAQQQAQTQQQQPQPRPPMQQQEAAALTPAQPQPTPQPAPVVQSPQPGPQLLEKKPTIEAIARAVVEHIEHGDTGFDLGDWYLEEFGEDEFRDARLQGKAQLRQDILTVHQTAAFFNEAAYLAALDKMITEFLTWQPPEDEDEDESDDEPPAAASNLADVAAGWKQPATEGARP